MNVIISPYPSPYYPWEAKMNGYSNVFATVEAAQRAMTARFGNCNFVVKDAQKEKASTT